MVYNLIAATCDHRIRCRSAPRWRTIIRHSCCQAIQPCPFGALRTLDQAVVTRRFPRVLIGASLALVLAGWLAIARSDEIVGAANHLVRQQIVWTVIGLSATAAIAMADY